MNYTYCFLVNMIKVINNYPDVIVKPAINNNKKTVYSTTNNIRTLIDNIPEADLYFYKQHQVYTTIVFGNMGKLNYSLIKDSYQICDRIMSYTEREGLIHIVQEAEFLTNIDY